MTSHPGQMECEAILFDLDGVLIDSTESVTRHWKDWADAHGLDVDEIMRVAFGVRTIETMRRVAPRLDAEKEAALFAEQEVRDTAGVASVEGAGRLLAAMPEGRWAIVTSCGAPLAQARLRQVDLPLPPVLITGNDIVRGKPAPDPYLAAAERLRLAKERCVVVEDAPAGIESARGAGMRVIGLTTTHDGAELLAKGAEVVIDRLSELEVRESGPHGALIVAWN